MNRDEFRQRAAIETASSLIHKYDMRVGREISEEFLLTLADVSAVVADALAARMFPEAAVERSSEMVVLTTKYNLLLAQLAAVEKQRDELRRACEAIWPFIEADQATIPDDDDPYQMAIASIGKAIADCE